MLKGKRIIITGANRGIGKAMAQKFSEYGADLILISRKRTEETENFYKSLSTDVAPFYFDLTDEEARKNFYKDIRKERIDGLVNNAGIMKTSLMFMTPMQTVREEMEINFFVVYHLTQFILKIMQKQKSGAILNITSTIAMDGERGRTSYSASKAAIIGFTKSLAKEVGDFGIRVNALAPFMVDTELLRGIPEEEINKSASKTVINRMAKPEEIAEIAAFLMSDGASLITGEIIRAQGGSL